MREDFDVNSMPSSLTPFYDNFDLKSASSTLTYNFKHLYKSVEKDFNSCKNFSYFSKTKLLKFNMNYEKKKLILPNVLMKKKIKSNFLPKTIS